jgi:hypothetical protein
MTCILSSLPKVYNLLITAWNLLPKEQQTLELLKLKLLEEEELLIDQTSTEDDTKAFAAWSANRTCQMTPSDSRRNASGNISSREQQQVHTPRISRSHYPPTRNTVPPYQHTSSTTDQRPILTYERRHKRQQYYDNLKCNTLCYECGEPGHWGKECAINLNVSEKKLSANNLTTPTVASWLPILLHRLQPRLPHIILTPTVPSSYRISS